MRGIWICVCVLVFVCSGSNAQQGTGNLVDKQGLKQGYWKVYYPNGNPRYEGYFKDNKPFGEFIRYFEEGGVMARMNHLPDGKTTRAKLFYENEGLAAEGKYINTRKDSTWCYYSFYTGKLTAKEEYVEGKREGLSEKYYESGKVSESQVWVADKKSGSWKQYFEHGAVKVEGFYQDDSREGEFLLYYPTGKVEVQGYFKAGLKHGVWQHFDPEGQLISEITYQDGNPVNELELDAQQQEFFNMIENQKGKIPEPEVEDLIPGAK
jgi:antitoxin component YwqK of YwqJK toxin-antitoxin module